MSFSLTAEWFFLTASLRAAAILLLACGLSIFLPKLNASAATRHKLWALALGASVAVPLFLAALPAWRISAPWANSAWLPVEFADPVAQSELTTDLIAWSKPVEDSPENALDENSVIPTERNPAIATISKSPTSVQHNPLTRPRTTWLLWVWACGASLAILPLVLGLISLRWLARSSRLVTHGPLFAILEQLTHQLGINRRIRLMTSNNRSMPMTWDLWRPTVLLPAAAASWSHDRLQIVFLHELAHIARRDCLTQILGQIARAVYWFNPLVWFAERQLRTEQEQACDDFVLSRGFDAPDYAEHLLAVSASCSSTSATPFALAMSHSSNLENRLMAILDPRLNRRPPSRSITRIMAALAAAATVLISVAHFESAVTASEAAAQKDANNAQPAAAANSDRSKSLADLRSTIAKHYVTPVNENEIDQGAIKGMLGALRDPYSDYLTPESLADIEKQIGGSIVGIGVQLEMHDKQIRVVTPLAGSPALKAGIQPGNVILEIDGQSTAGLEIAEVVKRIAGPAGTNVRLRISSDGGQTLNLNITRGTVNLPTVKGFRRASDSSWNFLLDDSNKIGYVQIGQFGAETPREARAALDSLKQYGLKGLILDLRYCPGGMLDSAVGVAKLFLYGTTIVTLHPRSGEPTTIKAEAAAALSDIPLLVLVNGQTASAGEVLAGALQDNQRAVVLGTRTIGKGSVQTLIKLDDGGGAIKLTTAQYRLPTGRSIDKRAGEKTWGINPNDGYFVPVSPAQAKTLLQRRQERDIIRATTEKDTTSSPAMNAASIEQQEGDPQLAAALRTMTGRLQAGAFAKVSTLTPAQIEQSLKREEIEQRRETAQKTLEKLDHELAELN